ATCVATSDHSAEASIETDGTKIVWQVTSTALVDWQKRPIGRLVLLHDISALRDVEAHLVERERALAAAQERERMARELHDGLAQDLWLAKLKTGRLAALPDLQSEARALTDEVTAAVDAGLEDARQAVAAMRLPGDGDGTIKALLSRSLEDFEDRFGLSVAFDCAGELPALPPRAEAETLRIAHEALTNVRRHADATVVRVRAAASDGRFVLEVRDNGCGFDPTATGRGTYGLAGMQERARLVGGEIQIESAPRQGTVVRLLVPAHEAEPITAGAS
ncbi:MAG TPA: sensor histidine kinase, partial [Candidatus Limnocylindrales bacterium]|nr:sensor histidine kinase [Candidatus Limnocylindrales bacterium]